VPAPAPRPNFEAASRSNDPIAALLAPSNRVLAVQQVLTQYGYGQIHPTGIMGPDTADAIRKFERSQRMPVTGQMSDQVVHALAQMSGRTIN
jgi:peptidoglycan hydrolase-like protein with peptidoglycan-binding domain